MVDSAKRRQPITTPFWCYTCFDTRHFQILHDVIRRIMSITDALKQEILRLAARQAKAHVAKAQKTAAEYRRQNAELKKVLRQREREIAHFRKQQAPADENPLMGVRFSAKSVRAQRQRLGISADDYGRLVGVSALTVLHWEQGKSRPRKSQLAALVSVRGISKKQALQRLATK